MRHGRWRRLAAALAGLAGLVVLGSVPAAAQTGERVTLPSFERDINGTPVMLAALLFRPEGAGPFPAVVGLHGCAGMFGPSGAVGALPRQWARRLLAAGYLVLIPDSLGSRGLDELCTRRRRPLTPAQGRRADALGALAWVQARADVDRRRTALIGWSHGGSTMLYVVSKDAMQPSELAALPGGLPRLAIAFYPGCAAPLRAGFATAVPLHVLMGADDDWTPAAPCRDLAAAASAAEGGPAVGLTLYPGAYHAFDHPTLSLRTRSGLAFTADGSGTAHVGADPAARADALERVPALLAEAFRAP